MSGSAGVWVGGYLCGWVCVWVGDITNLSTFLDHYIIGVSVRDAQHVGSDAISRATHTELMHHFIEGFWFLVSLFSQPFCNGM